MGVQWLGDPMGILIAEDRGALRWTDCNFCDRQSRTTTNCTMQCVTRTFPFMFLSKEGY